MNNLQEQLKGIGSLAGHDIQSRVHSNLMHQITNFENENNIKEVKNSLFLSLKSMKLAWQPVGIFAFVALLLLGSSGVVVVAAQNSMPGDNLFVVKRIVEKSQGILGSDSARRVELAGTFLGNRVDELQKALVQDSQLKSAGGSQKESQAVVLAVSEVKKQVGEVSARLKELKTKESNSNRETGVAALILNDKIRSYQNELQKAKDKIVNDETGQELNEVLEQVDVVNSDLLAVIVDKKDRGELEVSDEDLTNRLEEHVKQIEVKVAKVEEVISQDTKIDESLAVRAKEVKSKIEEAKKAIDKNEFKLVLTLSRDSNDILKMIYGDIYAVVKTDGSDVADEIVNEAQGEVKGVEDKIEVVDEVQDVNVAPTEENTVETNLEKDVEIEVPVEAEFEVKIQ